MNNVTALSGLLTLLVIAGGDRTAQAEELLTRHSFFVADESRHQWINEHNGRTGVLEVRGMLLTSPCTLVTNEYPRPVSAASQNGSRLFPLRLDLTGCGDGDDLTSAQTPAGRTSVTVAYSALLSGMEGGVLQPRQRMLGTGRVQLHGGSSQITWYLSPAQRRALSDRRSIRTADAPYVSPASVGLLRLRMDYE
ncbi:nuclease PIN [Salmonella enterica]|nr:nuclease PIN [Salmonella enterica]EHY0218370.1 nuclease PIN [Salmonella enterica]ELC4946999.1 nuclease PIN [Salmonella enterica]ELI8702839.1 nuclease PIN [Salmonella enterica]